MTTAAVEFNQDGDKLMSTFTGEDSVYMSGDPEVGLLWKHNLVTPDKATTRVIVPTVADLVNRKH